MINDKEFLRFEDGFFKPYFEKFIEYKRGKGEKVAHSTLIRFGRLNNALNKYDTDEITSDMIGELLAPHPGQSEHERQYLVSSLRQFCAFISTLNIAAALVPERYMQTARSGFRPYIFSEEELSKVADAADHLPSARRTNNHQLIYPVIIRILIGTGMRIGEVLSLKRKDVDVENGIILVVNGKNNVSRYIPAAPSLRLILQKYAGNLDMEEKERPFFSSPYSGEALTYSAMKYMIPKIFRMAGVKRNDGTTPNIHCLRHTFCTRSLSKMLDEGMDIYTAVPILAAYVGHVNYADTEKYIHFTEQDHESFIAKEAFLGMVIPEVPDE